MTGVLMQGVAAEGHTFAPFVEFQNSSESPPPGCFDFRVCQEWFRRPIPWPIDYTPHERLLAWLHETGIRHEWHAIVQREPDHTPQNFEGVFYFIRFFDKIDASAYRLIFA